jgi:proline dehydrogenase
MITSALRAVFLWLSNRHWLGRLAMGTPLLRRMPLRFVAGTTLDQAANVVRELNAAGMSATLDVLGEAVHDRATADRAAAAYVATIERIAADGLHAGVSIKLTQMGLDLGVDECLSVLQPVAEAGTEHGIFIRIDMESSAYTQQTLDVVDRLRSEGRNVGPVIQAYLHRSPADIERLAAACVPVRVCKGAYAEPAEVALTDRQQISDAMVEQVKVLLAADAFPAVASHDHEVIQRVAAFARERGIGPDRFEFQMLYGIRRDLQRRLVDEGWRVRVYVPYGTQWYPYYMRRLAERPANVLFVLPSVFGRRGRPN